MPYPWKHSRPSWMGLWATWSSWRCPCSLQGIWARWPVKAPSNPSPYDSMILKCMEESQLISHQFNSHLYGNRKLVPQGWRKGCLLEKSTVGCEGCCKHSIYFRNLFHTVSSWHSHWMDFFPIYMIQIFLRWWNAFGHKERDEHTFKIPNCCQEITVVAWSAI